MATPGLPAPAPVGGASPSPAPPASSFDDLFNQVQGAKQNGQDESILFGYNPEEQENIRGLANYKIPLGPAQLRMPYWQSVAAAAQQYDPSFSAADYQNRQKLKQSFESGPNATNITSLNMVMGHLKNLRDAGDALNNWGGLATPLNAPVDWMESKFNDPRVNNFQVASEIAANELPRALRGTGASEGDVKAWRDRFSPYAGPDVQHGAINEAIKALSSRVYELREQYQQGMGKAAPRFLDDKTRQILRSMGQDPDAVEGLQSTAAGRPGGSPPTVQPTPPIAPVNPNPGGYTVGHRYGGKTYLGPDSNNPASWK